MLVIEQSKVLETRLIANEESHGHVDGDGDEGHVHGTMNPHVWLDPTLMVQMVTNALRGFQAMDPEHSRYYETNAARYVRRLQAIDLELAEGLHALKGTGLVTF